jgi:hypothetical protein
LDIIGACLLWRYGLPEDINRKGESALLLESTNDKEIEKARAYDFLSRLALALLVAGFVLQLISNYT